MYYEHGSTGLLEGVRPLRR